MVQKKLIYLGLLLITGYFIFTERGRGLLMNVVKKATGLQPSVPQFNDMTPEEIINTIDKEGTENPNKLVSNSFNFGTWGGLKNEVDKEKEKFDRDKQNIDNAKQAIKNLPAGQTVIDAFTEQYMNNPFHLPSLADKLKELGVK